MTREERIRTALLRGFLQQASFRGPAYEFAPWADALVPVVAALLDAERPRWQPREQLIEQLLKAYRWRSKAVRVNEEEAASASGLILAEMRGRWPGYGRGWRKRRRSCGPTRFRHGTGSS